ncbi:SH3 domain-containing protein [Eubacteriales bacterium OttesenSCG-928-A19]|nr:SH3 domain-containing protein [Eubacteriales bacterium OttesenSCG-928-A19]
MRKAREGFPEKSHYGAISSNSRRRMKVWLACLLLLALILPAQVHADRLGFVRLDGDSPVNVRQKPNTDSSIIGKVRPGETYDAIGQDEKTGWYEIRLPDGKEGFVSNKMVTFEKPRLTAEEQETIAAELAGTAPDFGALLAALAEHPVGDRVLLYPRVLALLADSGQYEPYAAYCATLSADPSAWPGETAPDDMMGLYIASAAQGLAPAAMPWSTDLLTKAQAVAKDGPPTYQPVSPQTDTVLFVVSDSAMTLVDEKPVPYANAGLSAIAPDAWALMDALLDAVDGLIITSNPDEATAMLLYDVQYPLYGRYEPDGVDAYSCHITLTSIPLATGHEATFTHRSEPSYAISLADGQKVYYAAMPDADDYDGFALATFIDKGLGAPE